jgi:hypothetical protein
MITVYDVDWATAAEVGEHLGADVAPEMLAQWYRRGLARRVVIGTGPCRAVYYRLDDCVEAEMLTRVQPRGRPRRAA